MKVVLFCGGRGMRIREYSDQIPKPMVPIGYRPIIWHVMKYYAHFGHTEFILCLGYLGDSIKRYFLEYDEWLTNDFVLNGLDRSVALLNTDIDEWKITFVDTGMDANIGERLLAVQQFLDGEQYFFANYSDGLTDYPLPEMVDGFADSGQIASMLCVKPQQTYHVIDVGTDSRVQRIREFNSSDIRINGGYFLFHREIFSYIRPGEELVLKPFGRLIDEQKLNAVVYDGFWAGMDTFKDRQKLESLFSKGHAPWAVWDRRY